LDVTMIEASDGGRLQRSQAARRERVLAAVLELAAEGGYDAIQVRAIADRTGISSDTIYRYFGSRDRLVAEAVGQWSDREFYEPAPTWLEGDTAAERLLSYYRRIWAVWEANPRMLETYVRAARVEGDVPGGIADTGISSLVPVTQYAMRGVEPAYRDDALMAVEHFTHSAMTYVVRGQLSVDDVYPRLERLVRRLAQHPAMDDHRPRSWDWVDGEPG
jgi:TetR/AcrR family transcriptional regulator, cholesterol catabolism regulator